MKEREGDESDGAGEVTDEAAADERKREVHLGESTLYVADAISRAMKQIGAHLNACTRYWNDLTGCLSFTLVGGIDENGKPRCWT